MSPKSRISEIQIKYDTVVITTTDGITVYLSVNKDYYFLSFGNGGADAQVTVTGVHPIFQDRTPLAKLELPKDVYLTYGPPKKDQPKEDQDG